MEKKTTFSTADYRSYIKVCVALGKNASEILADMRALGQPSAPSKATVFRWVKHFASGQASTEDNRGKMRKIKKCDEKLVASVKAMVDADSRVSLEEIADYLDIHSSTASRILRNQLGYRKVSSRWIPHILTSENKGGRLRFCQEMLKIYKNCEPRRLDEIVTGDETWVYMYEPRRKSQNKAWIPKGGIRPQIARRQRSQKKVLYTIFFNTKGIVLQKPCKQGETITGKFYRDSVLSDIKKFYATSRPTAGMRGIKILHDNAPAHKSRLVQEYLAAENIHTLPHPAYSPDLAPCDFYLFPHLKKSLAGRSFKSRSALGTAVFQCLSHIPKEDYRAAFLKWIERMQKCVAAGGEYFEQMK